MGVESLDVSQQLQKCTFVQGRHHKLHKKSNLKKVYITLPWSLVLLYFFVHASVQLGKQKLIKSDLDSLGASSSGTHLPLSTLSTITLSVRNLGVISDTLSFKNHALSESPSFSSWSGSSLSDISSLLLPSSSLCRYLYWPDSTIVALCCSRLLANLQRAQNTPGLIVFRKWKDGYVLGWLPFRALIEFAIVFFMVCSQSV